VPYEPRPPSRGPLSAKDLREIPTQIANKAFDLGDTAAAGLGPLVHASPPVLARGTRVPRQHMDMQVRDLVTDHVGIHVLSLGDVAESLASPCAPPGTGTALVIPRAEPHRLT